MELQQIFIVFSQTLFALWHFA